MLLGPRGACEYISRTLVILSDMSAQGSRRLELARDFFYENCPVKDFNRLQITEAYETIRTRPSL